MPRLPDPCRPRAAPLSLRLQHAQFLRLPHPRGLQLRVQRGSLWITVDGQSRDIELAAGRCFEFADDRPALVTVFGAEADFQAWRPPVATAARPSPAWALA